MTIAVGGGCDQAECDRIARAVAHSPLVKTAFFASDPNPGPHSRGCGLWRTGRPGSIKGDGFI